MRRFAIIAICALAACRPGAEQRADSPGVQPIDTLKPVAASDTLPSLPRPDSVAAKSAPATSAKTAATKSTKLGRDSAFGPPKNLPQLDTIKKKKPTV